MVIYLLFKVCSSGDATFLPPQHRHEWFCTSGKSPLVLLVWGYFQVGDLRVCPAHSTQAWRRQEAWWFES